MKRQKTHENEENQRQFSTNIKSLTIEINLLRNTLQAKDDEIFRLNEQIDQNKYEENVYIGVEFQVRILSREIDRLNLEAQANEAELSDWRLNYSASGSLSKRVQDQMCLIVVRIGFVIVVGFRGDRVPEIKGDGEGEGDRGGTEGKHCTFPKMIDRYIFINTECISGTTITHKIIRTR